MDRGIAVFIIFANLVRRFEFAQNVWINDTTFHELGNEHDPICATRDGAIGLHCSEAADPHDAQGTSSIHDPQGPIFLPTRAEGDALSLDAARLRIAMNTMPGARSYHQSHVVRPHAGARAAASTERGVIPGSRNEIQL